MFFIRYMIQSLDTLFKMSKLHYCIVSRLVKSELFSVTEMSTQKNKTAKGIAVLKKKDLVPCYFYLGSIYCCSPIRTTKIHFMFLQNFTL